MRCFRQHYGTLSLAFGIGLLFSFLMPEKIAIIVVCILVLILSFMLMNNC